MWNQVNLSWQEIMLRKATSEEGRFISTKSVVDATLEVRNPQIPGAKRAYSIFYVLPRSCWMRCVRKLDWMLIAGAPIGICLSAITDARCKALRREPADGALLPRQRAFFAPTTSAQPDTPCTESLFDRKHPCEGCVLGLNLGVNWR